MKKINVIVKDKNTLVLSEDGKKDDYIDLSDLADLADAEKDQIDMVLSCIKLYKLSIDIMKEQAEIIDRLDDRTEKLVSQNEELMGKLNKLDELDGDIRKILQQVSKKS